MLCRRGALSLPGRECLWRGTACDGDHPFIRLRNTGGAHVARLKRDAHLQGCAAGADSTCHAGLLAPVALGGREAPLSGVEPPETHHHTWVAVVSVECSSSTLPKSWQHCRKCNDTALWCTIFCRVEDGFVHVACFQPFLEDGFLHWNMAQQPWVADFIKRPHILIPLSTTHW